MTTPTQTQDQVRLTVAGMTCEACAVCVRQALAAAGAREVHVDVGRKEATFTLPAGVAPAALRAAVRAAGYLPGWVEPRPGA
jgi:copper chaperone CopZ